MGEIDFSFHAVSTAEGMSDDSSVDTLLDKKAGGEDDDDDDEPTVAHAARHLGR